MKALWRSMVACTSLLVLCPVDLDAGGRRLFNPLISVAADATVQPETWVPSLRKQSLPQALHTLYSWKGHGDTNYARDLYRQYVGLRLEGDRFYDLYGNYITRGRHVYAWHQNYPQQYGSGIFKDFIGPPLVVISSSTKGGLHTAVTIGEGIRTTLTPLTFSKPLFDGLQWDLSADRCAFTGLASRIDNPANQVISFEQGPSQKTLSTQLLALHGVLEASRHVKIGATFVTAFHQSSALALEDNSLRGVLDGTLNAGQVRQLSVRVSDDSPGDGEGARLYRDRILINGVPHPEIQSTIEGGIQRPAFIEATATEPVLLNYDIARDFAAATEEGTASYREARKIEVELVLAGDYRVDATSNMQTNSVGEPVFLPVTRAQQNITDGSNLGVVRFQYGLPTANQLRGLSLDLRALGVDLRSEYVSNRRFRRFPNNDFRTNHELATDAAEAYYVTASWQSYPLFAYGELFSMDPDYTTSMFIPDQHDRIYYDDERRYLYEFVEDNDDQDRFPDWERRHIGIFAASGDMPDRAVFPGLDENLDSVSDFNQNQNHTPDYAEPFLRFHVDPPELLYGVDMNNNTVIDRFENDSEADYPYKRDHAGYNAYVGVEVLPRSKVTVGLLREYLKSSGERATSLYALLTGHREFPEQGVRIQLVGSAKIVKDNIADDVIQWLEAPSRPGAMREVPDPLVARNALISSTYLEVEYDQSLRASTRLKLETHDHRGRHRQGRRNGRLLAWVSRAGRHIPIAPKLHVSPRWKQILKVQTPAGPGAATRELSEIGLLIASYSISPELWVRVGTEHEVFANLHQPEETTDPSPRPDSRQWTLGLQISNMSEYLGYRLNTNIGFRRTSICSGGETDASIMGFVDIYAGLGTDN